MTCPGDEREVFIPDVVENVHHRIGQSDVCNGSIRQHPLHRLPEHFPLLRAPKIIDYQKPASQQVFPQPRDLCVRQSPPAGLGRINPGIIKQPIIGETQMAWISSLDPGQALNAGRKVIVGIGPIHQPPAFSAPIAGRVAPTPVILWQIGILQADEMELGLGRKSRPRTFILFLLNPESLCQRADGQ